MLIAALQLEKNKYKIKLQSVSIRKKKNNKKTGI